MRRSLTAVTALATVAVCTILVAAPAQAVVGGREADPGEWPWQVALLVDGGIWCGGSLVAPDVVLTAAHCTDGVDPAALSVLAGTIDLRSGGERRGVESIDQHDDYNDVALINDISLLRLDAAFELTDSIALAQLASVEQSAAFSEAGDAAVVTGFGAVEENGAPSDLLLEADLETFADIRCEALYREDGDAVFGDTQVCAGRERGHVDACYGDSGGPLVAPTDDSQDEWVQIGLVSWGAGCAAPERPTIYTEVSAFTDWLFERGVGSGEGERFEGSGARLPARGSRGKAGTYPLTIDVSGFEGDLESVSVQLVGLSHERPEDLDVWLVAPDGTTVTLLSDVGGDEVLRSVDLLVVDGAADADASQLGPQLSPTDRETDAQRKGARPGTELSAFAGIDPNGPWQLLVADDRPGASGDLDGWSLLLR